MIYNTSTIRAKVWDVTPSQNGKYIDLRISTSERNKDDTEWINSSWFPRAIGKAVNTLKSLQKGDSIIITKSKFTNECTQTDEGKKSFFHFLILEATRDDKSNQNDTKQNSDKVDVKAVKSEPVTPSKEEEIPW